MNATEMPLERPWQALDPAVREVVTPAIGPVAEDITAAIAASINEYRQPMRGAFGRGVRLAIDSALRQFVEQIGQPASGVRPGREIYIALGRGEYRAGRPLDALQAAYRLGARVAWRRIAAVARESGIDGATLSLLAESIFAYIDELSAKSAEGYALEQSAAAGERRAQRQRLARLLLRDPPADPLDVEEVARAAQWRLPATLSAFAFPEPESERIVTRLPADAIVDPVGAVVCALLPDPERAGLRAQLQHAVGPRHVAALGPAVAWGDAALSLARARAVLQLAAEGGAPGHGVLDAADHTTALLLRSDRRLTQELVRARLAPLADLAAGPRTRLTATLAAWLAAQGRLQAVAERLHVHPQTVRYRLAQLRELFGDALDDPQRRFELELALRAEGAFEPAAGDAG